MVFGLLKTAGEITAPAVLHYEKDCLMMRLETAHAACEGELDGEVR